MDNKKNPSVRDADQDLSGYIGIANKVWEHFFLFPDKKISEIMALSAYIDQPLSKITLGEALSKEDWNGKNSSIQSTILTLPSSFSYKQTNKYLVL